MGTPSGMGAPKWRAAAAMGFAGASFMVASRLHLGVRRKPSTARWRLKGSDLASADSVSRSSVWPERLAVPRTRSGQPSPWAGMRSQRWTSARLRWPVRASPEREPSKWREASTRPCTPGSWPRRRVIRSEMWLCSSCRPMLRRLRPSGPGRKRPRALTAAKPSAGRSVRAGEPEKRTPMAPLGAG